MLVSCLRSSLLRPDRDVRVGHGSVQMIHGLLACKQRSMKLPQSKHWSGSHRVCRSDLLRRPCCTEVLDSSTIPVQVRTLDPTSLLCPCFVLLAKRGQRSSRESCIVLENKPTCSLHCQDFTAFIGCSM